MSDYLAIYAAILSTLLAFPVIRDLIGMYFRSLRIICIDYTNMSVSKDREEMEISHYFEITIFNRSKEVRHLSHVNLEVKFGSKKGYVSLDPYFITSEFVNKIDYGEGYKEVIYYVDNHLNHEDHAIMENYTKFRIKVED